MIAATSMKINNNMNQRRLPVPNRYRTHRVIPVRAKMLRATTERIRKAAGLPDLEPCPTTAWIW
jgi:hypothetical protein